MTRSPSCLSKLSGILSLAEGTYSPLQVDEERLIEYRCECGAADCSASVLMTFSERDTVDHVADRWAIAPGHALQEGDRLLERHARYWVVEGSAP